jgi:iron complex outermembrane receptor protein
MIELRPLLFATPLLICVNSVMAQETTYDIDIPAQSLSSALDSLARQTDIKPFFNDSLVSGKSSPAVQGRYTSYEALQKLLIGSDLTYKFTSKNAVTINATESGNDEALTLPAVRVVGKAGYDSNDPHNTDYNRTQTRTATKTDTALMETPMNVQIVPQQILKDQQVVRLDKALQNVSGVFATAQDGHQQTPFVVRGFRTYDYYRDGVRTQPSWLTDGFRETANLERVEVLKGPASILYGRIAPGGMINVVTKQPSATPFYALQQQFGSYDFYRTTVDATGPVNNDKSLLYRANFAYEDGGSYRDFVKNDRVFFAPKLQWNISDRTQATFELEYKHSNDTYDNGIPLINGHIPSVPIGRNLSEPGFGDQESDALWLGFNWSHAFSDRWTLRHTFNAYTFDSPMRTPFVTYWGGLANNCTLTACEANRGAMTNHWGGQQYYNSINLTGKIDTGPLEHTLLMGWDYTNMTASSGAATSWKLNPIDIFDPQYTGISTMPTNAYTGVYNLDEDWHGLYMQDQAKLPFNLHLLAGFRYDMATMNDLYSDASASSGNKLNESAIKPRVGLLWQALPELSVYANYVENFGGANLYGHTRTGTPLSPEMAQQKEIGLKTELFDKRFTGSIAWFDLTKQNIQSPDPDPYWRNLGASVTTGEVNNNGLEVDFSGEAYPGLKLIGNYSYTNSKVTKDTGGLNNQGNEGHRYFGVPRHAGSLWTTYEIQAGELQGLKLGAGSLIKGQVEGDTANSYQLLGYATLGLMAGYSWHMGPSKVTAQINADNLLDKRYYSTSNSNFVMPGAPRTLMGTVRVEF